MNPPAISGDSGGWNFLSHVLGWKGLVVNGLVGSGAAGLFRIGEHSGRAWETAAPTVRARHLARELAEDGIPAALIDRIVCPLGLPLGSNDPAEIAISVAAQLLDRRGNR